MSLSHEPGAVNGNHTQVVLVLYGEEPQALAPSPGTTPLVAMALIEMAVSIVCKEKQLFQEVCAPRFSNMLSLGCRLLTSKEA